MSTRARNSYSIFRFTVAIIAVLTVALLSSLVALRVSTATGPNPRPPGQVVAFVNANVVPMDSERVLEGQTVVVRDGRIAEIGPADKTSVPAEAARIDCAGKYILPGLVDMHAHLASGVGAEGDPAAQQMALYLANGVTTVRGMFGAATHLVLRDKVARGELPGPTIYAAGPPILGGEAPTPQAGERIVSEQKAAGYDFIKVHEGLSSQTYRAIMARARQLSIPVAGHVTLSVGLSRALEANQTSIEHLDGYINAIIADNAPVNPSPSQIILGPVINNIDEKKIPALAQATRNSNVWNTPTLALFKIIVSDDRPEDLLKHPEMRYVPLNKRAEFAAQKQSTLDNPGPASERRRFSEIRNKITKGLYDAGAKILTGSDSPQFFLVPGFAVHRELQSLVGAGLSPYASLEAATRNAAEYLAEFAGAPDDAGTIEVGKRADLIVVEGNPLQDIANAARIRGVMVRGRWLVEGELGRMLDDVARLHAPRISGVEIKGKKLIVRGQNFEPAASILIEDSAQKTKNDGASPSTILIAKKAGKLINQGQPVNIEILNPSGSRSDKFLFTRP